MKKLNKKRTIITSSLFLLIFILGFFQTAKISKASPQYNNENKILTVSSNFSMYEFSNEFKSNENITSIDISLPSSTWNLTDIQVNFTEIEFNREIRVIENEPDDSNFIDKSNIIGISVQMNLTDPIILYGVHIYGRAINPKPTDQVYIEIRGYDTLNNRPDVIVLIQEDLNMSEELIWHFQNFSTPLSLSAGNYSLVMRQTNIQLLTTRYVWFYSYINPKNPNLHISFNPTGWSTGYSGTPQLYKLDQKLNFTVKPEELNMQAEINGDTYPVLNGVDLIKGKLSIPNVDYSSNTDTLPISIKNNKSSSLLFNATYNYKLKNLFTSGGKVLIRESFNNTWIVNPTFIRTSNNYSIKFEYPKSWFNVTVFKKGINTEGIDSNVTIDDEAVYILNGTIDGSTWKITANSEKVNFDATPQLESYIPGQLLRITINAPPSVDKSNLTVVLLDSGGFFEYNYTKENPSSTFIFEYGIPILAIGGTWTALIFWNNYTDAGLESAVFQITVSGGNGDGDDDDGDSTIITGIDPQLVYMTILYIVIGSIIGLSSYKMVKRHIRTEAEHGQKIFNKFIDLLNLDYIMIKDKKSGLNVYERVLAGKERDVSLISGFLEAIRSFGIELSGSEDESQTIRLQYQNMNIIMNDFKNFRILNVMKEPPSQDFLDSLRPLSYDIDTYYGKSLKEFDGGLAKFRGIKDLIEEHLQTPLIYPLKIVMTKETKLDLAEKSLVNKALNIMKKNTVDHFYVSYLMETSKEFNVKNAEKILKLIEKKVFQPIE